MACIVKNKEFRALQDKFDIQEDSLEQIIKEWQSISPERDGKLPSEAELNDIIYGGENLISEDLLDKATKIWKQQFSKRIVFDSMDSAEPYVDMARRFFAPQAITIKTTKDGRTEISVAKPEKREYDIDNDIYTNSDTNTTAELSLEEQSIKDSAIKNGTFMKAPNGKPTNLTEKQWLQVRTKAFKEWFGDWENDTANASKVVDENGEPMVVYHGGATEISIFKTGNEDSSTTGYGTYTEKGTGRQIPVDSARTIFFSSNKFVAESYAQLYALRYFNDIEHKVQNMIGNLYGDEAHYSVEDFKTINEFYDFLTIISKFNPRFAKLRDYIKELRGKGERLKPNEVNAARQLFIDLRKTLKEYTEDWNLVSSQWDDALTTGSQVIKEYNSLEGVKRLKNGEIPEPIKKEWELFQKIQSHREKYGLRKIGNYSKAYVWLSSRANLSFNDYILKYSGDELILDNVNGKRNIPISQLSEDEILKFFADAKESNELSIKERNNDNVKQEYNNISGQYPVFLNIKNPFVHDYEGTHMGQGYKQNPNISFEYVAARQVDKAIRDGNDGVIYKNIYDPYLADNYGVFNPNQIKSATENSGEFSGEDNNIYNEGEYKKALWPRDERLVSLYDKSENGNIRIADLLSLIDSNSEFSGIIDLLKSRGKSNGSLLSGVKVKLDFANTTGMYDTSRAYYDAGDKTIHINYIAGFENGRADSVILHEVLHAITVNKILGNKTFRTEFDSIIDKYLETNHEPSARRRYAKEYMGEQNPHYMEEFIADVWSNRDLIDQLKAIKSTKNLTLWDRIKQFFTKIFAGSNNTLLADASDAIYRLLDQPEIISNSNRDNIFRENEINIYGGLGENVELSNFAVRPFDDGSGIIFNTVEGAFQAAKLPYSQESGPRHDELLDKLSKASGEEARKIGRTIKGLHVEAWDIQSPRIMKELIKASFEQNPDALQKLLATGDAILTHEPDNTKWGKEFPRILMEVRSELKDGNKESFVENKSEAARQNVPQAIRKTNEGYVRQAVKFNREIDNLLNGTVVAPIEARETAVQIAYFMHDTITALLKDPKIIFNESLFGKQDVKDIDKETKKVKKMSRRQLVQYVGARNLINYVKSQVFDNVQEFWTTEMLNQAQLFKNNFDALVKLGTTTFLQIEDFGITSNTTTEEAVNTTGVEDFNVIDNPGIDADDFASGVDYDSIVDEIGNLQEHWQIESRSLDVLQNATALVKEALGSCYITKKIETKNEDGTTSYTYEPTVSKWGIKTRMNPKDATSSILLWTRGSLKLSDMIAKLEKASESSPWVQQIIDRLKDTSGKESEFQSQFYKVFEKHFQLYGVVSRDAETGKLKAMPVNQRPALREAMRTIRNAYEAGTSPLFTDRRLNQNTLSEMTKMWQDALAIKDQKFEDADLAKASRIISLFMNDMGYNANEEMVLSALSQQNLNNMVSAMGYIVAKLKTAIGNIEYKPFEYNGENSISGNVRELVKPIADLLEDVAITSINQSGKTYQSNVTPSYLSKMMIKLQGDNDEFSRFIQSEYFGDAWYRDQSKEEGGWKNKWLYELSRMDEETRKKVLAHKVQLNFNGQSYMRGMTGSEYIVSMLSEFFEPDEISGKKVAWYRIPMMSNKPSSEFIRFIRYNGADYKSTIISGLHDVFNQEISRIQTVEMMDEQGSNVEIENFRKKGKDFQFLDFLNKERRNGTELGKLIDAKIKGQNIESEGETRLKNLLDGYVDKDGVRHIGAIEKAIDAKADAIIEKWKKLGIFEQLDSIQGISRDFSNREDAVRNFIWNDTFAAINFLELTVTDVALYKNAEDLQKRLAQLHSPGLRGNVEATDFDGNKVAGDGTIKSIVISDFKKVKSNVIDNLSAVFDKKIQRAEATGDTRSAEGWRVTKESIISQFEDINVTDGQAYKCPVSARKIGFIFGTWTRENEELYKKFISGNYTYSDVRNAFSQPRKPFVYGTTTKSLGVDGAPLNIIRKGVQYKNSEYLLILADAIMKSEKTGMPNLLRSIYAFMEQSFKINPNNGIDTVMFDSCVKTGKGNMLDINQFLSMEGEAGENAAYQYLMNNVILDGGVYNDLYVDKVGIEDYSEQQEIPEHFKDHEQVHGSQVRYIIPSDLEFVDDAGNPITYDYVDNGVAKKVNATEFRDEYERTVAENINEDIEAIKQEIGLGSYFMSNADKNVAISKLLQREILSNPRYGVDLLQACSVDENGNFKIPLNDPIQSRRVEQLLNSVVKNGVNKQKLAGGPIVQVSNFGTSHRLSIVFKGKDGNVLVNRSEYKAEEHDGKSYEDYVKENQAGIAYFEAYAPIYSDELLKFADENGVINTDVIERVNPDLLKMIGYRIPSEDKYSVVPIKIVGFLPREAGDALMLPYEITTLTGSDFDIDKIYCIRKEIKLTRGIEQALKDELKPDFSNEESKKAFFAEKNKRIREQLFNVLPDDVLSQDERNAIEDNVDEVGSVYKDEEGNEKRIEPMNEQYDKLEEQHKAAIEKINKKYAEDEEKRNKAIDKETKEYNKKLADLEKVRAKRIAKGVVYQNKVKKHQLITDFLKSDKFAPTEDPTTLAMRDKWISLVYGTSVKQEGRAYRNNKIFDMSWATLTHETTASKMLNPGGFTPQKTVGYAVTAYKNGVTKEDGTKYSLSELMALDVDTLKDLCYSNKNLVYIDTHVQFYNQNAAASQILGIFAVAKVAHTALSGYNYAVDVASTLQTANEFNIMGHSIGGMMEIDPMYDSNGALISKTLGSLVASAADAVKDPVLNLMNINADTVNVLNVAIRLGIPFEDIALLLSTDTISRAIQYYNTQKLGGKVTFNKIVGEWIRSYERANKIDATKLPAEKLTREEVETAINGEQTKEVDYKILKAYDRLSKIANQIRGIDFLTRFNSITSAVGPQIIDNISKEYKYDKFGNNIYKQNIGYQYNNKLYHIGDTIDIDGTSVLLDVPTAQRLVKSGVISIGQTETRKIKQVDVLNEHPILDAFSNTLDLSKEIMSVFPQYSGSFRGAIAQLGENTERFLMSKDGRSLLSNFSDFYQSYLLIQSGAIKQEEAKYLIEQLPIDFFKHNVKQWFPNNPFIQAITQGIINTKDGKTRATLEINTNGLDSTQIEKLQIGWAQLQKDRPELSRKLFKYAFFKGGIGFNPKTFMNLAPIQVKLAFKEYIETYANPPEVAPRDVAIQFVRNNGSNTELVPIVDVNLKPFGDSGMFYSGDYRMNSLDYFKIGDQNSQIFYFTGTTTPAGVRLFAAMTELGNHGEYLEFTQKPMLNDGIQQASQMQPITVDSAPVMEQMTENEFDASKALREIFNEAQIGKHKAYQETVKDSPEHRELYIKHFDEQLSKKGIKLNREQLEEVYNEFC